MSAMSSIATACIGEPISWLRLEKLARGDTDTSVREHLAACAACKQCFAEIERDVVALPPLVVPVRKRPWWQFAIPAGLALAAAALLVVVLRPKPHAIDNGLARVKGVGEVLVDVVRERSGTIRQDVRTFAEGDRFKIVVTCPPQHTATFDVDVREAGNDTYDHPIPTAQLACGNRVVLPGAFTLGGKHAHRVCVHVTSSTNDRGTACLELRPE
jgi:hypothetical protein